MSNQAKANIGVVGLAVMGSNLARNLASRAGNTVAVYNRTFARTQTLVTEHPEAGFVAAESIDDFVASLATPRTAIIMVQAGACLCSLVSNAPSEQILMHCFSTVGVLSGLLALQNPDLQYNVLQTLRKLFEFVVNQAMHAHLNPAHVAHLRDTLSHLSLHPLAEICQIARTLEEILDVVST